MSKPSNTPADRSSPPPQPAVGRSATTVALVIGILLAAAALRIYDVSTKDLWIDEANGVLMAQQSLPELFTRLKLDSSPPLYYIILHGWMKVFGDSEAALRAVSILGGIAMVACVFVVGRRLFSLETGMIAAILVATSPIQIFYSQQARMYSLLPVLALLSFYWLWRAIVDNRRRFVVAYGFATLAALYLHNYGFYLLPAHAAVLLWSGALRKKPGTWLICAGCIVAAYLPWLPILLAQLDNKTHYSWFIPFWREYGPWGSLLRTLDSFAPAGRQPSYVNLQSWPQWGRLASGIFSAVAALGVVRLFRRSRGGVALNAEVGWLLSFVWIPLLGVLLASTLITPNYVPGRCDQLVFPGFVLLVAAGLTVIKPRVLRYALLAVFLGFSAMGLRLYYGSPVPISDRAIARAIAKRVQPGDAVLCTSLTRASLEYYLRRYQVPVTFFSYPRDTARHLGNLDDFALLKNPGKLQNEVRIVKQEILAECGPHSRCFVVLAHRPVNKFLSKALRKPGWSTTLEVIGEYRQAGIHVRVIVMLEQF